MTSMLHDAHYTWLHMQLKEGIRHMGSANYKFGCTACSSNLSYCAFSPAAGKTFAALAPSIPAPPRDAQPLHFLAWVMTTDTFHVVLIPRSDVQRMQWCWHACRPS